MYGRQITGDKRQVTDNRCKIHLFESSIGLGSSQKPRPMMLHICVLGFVF